MSRKELPRLRWRIAEDDIGVGQIDRGRFADPLYGFLNRSHPALAGHDRHAATFRHVEVAEEPAASGQFSGGDVVELAAWFGQQRAGRLAICFGQPAEIAGEVEQMLANLLVG